MNIPVQVKAFFASEANKIPPRAENYAPAPTQNPTPESVVSPEQYYPAQYPSFSDWIMRSVFLTAQSILDPLQYLNQSYQVHDYEYGGRWIPVAQNIAPLTLEGAWKQATLVPAYGQYMDTVQDVYRNISQGGMS